MQLERRFSSATVRPSIRRGETDSRLDIIRFSSLIISSRIAHTAIPPSKTTTKIIIRHTYLSAPTRWHFSMFYYNILYFSTHCVCVRVCYIDPGPWNTKKKIYIYIQWQCPFLKTPSVGVMFYIILFGEKPVKRSGGVTKVKGRRQTISLRLYYRSVLVFRQWKRCLISDPRGKRETHQW